MTCGRSLYIAVRCGAWAEKREGTSDNVRKNRVGSLNPDYESSVVTDASGTLKLSRCMEHRSSLSSWRVSKTEMVSACPSRKMSCRVGATAYISRGVMASLCEMSAHSTTSRPKCRIDGRERVLFRAYF